MGTGDCSGDGLADVLFRNLTSGDFGYEPATAADPGTHVSLGTMAASFKSYRADHAR